MNKWYAYKESNGQYSILAKGGIVIAQNVSKEHILTIMEEHEKQCVQPDQYRFQQCECPDCRNRDYLEDAKLDRDQSERNEV